jgi:DNA-binding IclR family transcriptional regulator
VSDDRGILGYLKRAEVRDAEKGGAGLRNTREVAEQTGLGTAAARRHLAILEESGLIECAGKVEGCGQALQWRLAPGG